MNLEQIYRQYNEVFSRSKELNERNDCVVKAMAISCDISYDQAHEAHQKVGRKHRRGFVTDNIEDVYENIGANLELIGEPPKQPSGYSYTPKTIHKLCQQGRFICFCRGHIFAVVDGEVLDWTANTKHRITKVYKVTM